ncbi:MAG: DegT/DnrJ/EryC1/StrS family aminotransferase [Desulfobacterales bacterium]|nr:DegT/DnrJ/EryC1/StrS family aminotransferase [Desulfobacterales bacterium]
MKVPFVDLKRQYETIKREIDHAIADCIEHSAFVQGKRVQQFEKAFANYLQVNYVIGCANGTDAIFLSLKALGIRQGDEVITSANTFIATSEAISMTGAKVVFVDVDQNTNNLNVNTVEAKITEHTKAIVPVHLYGYPADMLELQIIAQKYHLRIVADAAQAHGSEINGESIAKFADITTYSFFPGKNLGAFGDAGAVATNDRHIADYIDKLRNHGRTEKYVHDFEGVNMRMDEMQGAILLAKLSFLNEWTAQRRSHAAYYNENLKGIGDVIISYDDPNVTAVYHLYVIETSQRDALQRHLSENGIATGIHYPIPLPLQPAYAYLKMSSTDIPVSSHKAKQILSLPMFPEITKDEQDFVIENIKQFFRKG